MTVAELTKLGQQQLQAIRQREEEKQRQERERERAAHMKLCHLLIKHQIIPSSLIGYTLPYIGEYDDALPYRQGMAIVLRIPEMDDIILDITIQPGTAIESSIRVGSSRMTTDNITLALALAKESWDAMMKHEEL
jgi:hypothetical protein